MKKAALALSCGIWIFILGCSSDDSTESPQIPEAATYKVINNGSAGVTTANDSGDDDPLGIAQAIPSGADDAYPVNVPIVFFLNDKILLSSITTETFKVTENNIAVGGTISVNAASNGFAILTFIPKHTFKPSATINITLTDGLKDDGNNGMAQSAFTFQTLAAQPTDFSDNGGFENGSDGVMFVGDGNILTGQYGCMGAFAGSSFAAISTGSQLVSSDTALGDASTIMIVGPNTTGATSSLTFQYNFLSAEFQEYVGSVFDDSFVVIVYGDDGAYTELVTSVNLVGLEGNTQCTGFPGMADAGDEYYGSTGWISKTMEFPSVGANAHAIFVATDVTDHIFSTIVGVDDVSFGN